MCVCVYCRSNVKFIDFLNEEFNKYYVINKFTFNQSTSLVNLYLPIFNDHFKNFKKYQ